MNFVVNNNGDSFQTLYSQYCALSEALNGLEMALSATRPHGRNYQTLDNAMEALQMDLKTHKAAYDAIRVIKDYEASIAFRLMDQKL